MHADHVFGRPSTRFRKYQVFTVVLLWSIYLYAGDQHGPAPFRHLSRYLSRRVTTWRTVVIAFLSLYVSRNFARVVGLESPEPLAMLYTRSYFRATWVTTALDAGFWTAMHLRPKWFRDVCSVLFTVYYLICAEQADEMVRKVRGGLTLEHLRVSWDKPTTPYIAAVGRLLRPRWMRVRPRQLRIPRPPASSYKEPIDAWLYFDGARKDLLNHDKVVLDVPGGGFVAMTPRCHDDKLMAWAAKTGLPVLALNYKKAPEYPYPYALNECYDAYHTLMSSRGRCIGLSGSSTPKVVLSGDSAGGNLAVGLILMLLQESPHTSFFPGDRRHQMALPLPEALVSIYPALDMNITNWMSDEQMALIKAPESRRVNKRVLRQKSDDYRRLTPDTPHASDDEDDFEGHGASSKLNRTVSKSEKLLQEANLTESRALISPDQTRASFPALTQKISNTKPQPLRTRLAMSSMISYFNDRILSPEMLRAMIILYIGPYNRPDFATDFLLSPLKAPEQLLARFPKVYLLTGERDPLVDDTVIFAGRLRQAHWLKFRERQELGLISESEKFDESRYVEVNLIPGISHGFLQFVSVYHDGWKYIFQCSRWMKEVFHEADLREAQTPTTAGFDGPNFPDYFARAPTTSRPLSPMAHRHHRRKESSDAEDHPLEMSSLSMSDRAHAAGRTKTSGGKHAGSGRGHVRKAMYSGRKSPIATRKSLVRLSSQEDLVGRRMLGLAGGLMGAEQVPQTP